MAEQLCTKKQKSIAEVILNFYAVVFSFAFFILVDPLIRSSVESTLVSKSFTGRLLSISCNKNEVAASPISKAGCCKKIYFENIFGEWKPE